jgi:hypothetical protein
MTSDSDLNEDFSDLLRELLNHDVQFLIVGAHAMAVHGVPRATGDIDIFFAPTPSNVQSLMQALTAFGAPIESHGVSEDSLLTLGTIYQLGLPPRRIDLINRIDGVSFAEAWDTRIYTKVDQLKLPVIGIDALRKNKESTGREKDKLDIILIEQLKSSNGDP